jgi:benzoate transport
MKPVSTTSAFEWLDRLRFTSFHKRLAILSILVTIFGGYSSQIIAYIVPLALKEWDLTPVKAGTMISYGFLGLTVGAVGFGMVSDRLGRKKLIMLVVLVFSVFNGAAYFAPNFEIFCLFRFLAGLGIGGVIPLTVTLASEFSPSGVRAKVVTAVGGSFTIGWALAGVVAMVLIPRFGWRVVLLVGTAPVLILPALHAYLPESVRFLASKGRYPEAIGLMRKIEKITGLQPGKWGPESFAQQGMQQDGNLRDLLRPDLRLMTVLVWGTYLFSMLALYGLSTWLPALLAGAGFSLVKSYGYAIVQSVGAMVGGIALGCCMDAFGRKLGLCLSFFMGGLSLLLFAYVTSEAWLYVAGAASGLFMVGIPAALHVVANEIYPTRIRSTGAGWAYAMGRFGSIVGPVMGGVVQTAGFSTHQFFLFFSLPCFVCMVLVAFYPIGVKNEGLEAVVVKLLK